MKNYLLCIILVLITVCTYAQIIFIPDPNFKAALMAYSPSIDLNNDKEIQFSEARVVRSLDIRNKYIQNLLGIEFFTALVGLDCSSNRLTYLDVSKNTALTYVICEDNQLATLNVNMNTSLAILDCSNNQITTLDVSRNTALTNLSCDNNQLATLDVTKTLYCIPWDAIPTNCPHWI